MVKYTKSHERDENRKMNKAFFRSLWAILLFWVPVLGVFLAADGFVRMCVRLTRRHRGKRAFLTTLCAVVLIAVLGAQVAGLYFYVQDPAILTESLTRVWTAVTGQETLPGAIPQDDFTDYDYNVDPYAMDEYGTDDLSFEDDYDGDFDDSYLEGFPEDETGDAAAGSETDYDESELFNLMMENKRSGTLTHP